MIRPAPPAGIVLVAIVLAVFESPAAANSINLLQPGSQSSSRLLFDLAQLPTQGADDAAIDPDRDCVAVADEARNRQTRFGTANWTRGRLSWEWDPGDEPVLVYLMCVNRKRSEPTWGGLEFGAGLSWAGAPMFFRQIRALGLAGDVAGEPILTSFEIGETPFISWPGQDDTPTPSDDPNNPIGTIDPTPVLFDIPITPSTTTSLTSSAGAPASGGDPPIFLDPINAVENLPVPEPSTWLLIGTGLAFAWKLRRRHL
jgi:hypothetical protein